MTAIHHIRCFLINISKFYSQKIKTFATDSILFKLNYHCLLHSTFSSLLFREVLDIFKASVIIHRYKLGYYRYYWHEERHMSLQVLCHQNKLAWLSVAFIDLIFSKTHHFFKIRIVTFVYIYSSL